MAYLAKAGFDVFALDLTGYGRSTRPPAMADACNIQKASQAQFVPKPLPAACAPTYAQPITTIASDWDDIAAVVDWLRATRHVDKVSLVGWSQGGPRTAGYTARNPDKVARLVVLAPAYTRNGPADAPASFRSDDGTMTAQSHADFTANWDRQVGCADQYDAGTSAAVWRAMLASDPVGAGWGPGCAARRKCPAGASTRPSPRESTRLI